MIVDTLVVDAKTDPIIVPKLLREIGAVRIDHYVVTLSAGRLYTRMLFKL